MVCAPRQEVEDIYAQDVNASGPRGRLSVRGQPSAICLVCSSSASFRAEPMPSDIVFVITLYGPGGQHMLGAAGGGIPVRVRVSDADGECDSPAGRGAEFEALARHNHADYW